MKILLDNSGYGLNNVGDAAMLKVAIHRLLEVFPKARVDVFTKQPKLLKELHPAARALSIQGRNVWFDRGYVSGLARPVLTAGLFSRVVDKEASLTWAQRERLLPLLTLRMRIHRKRPENLRRFLDVFNSADLVVCSGGGYINDAIAHHALGVMRTLRAAMAKGYKTAMMSQGIGTVTNPQLLRELEGILPRLDFLSLRKREGLDFLRSLGVDSRRVMITGDDAIELGSKLRPSEQGSALGINIRIAKYSELRSSNANRLSEWLRGFLDNKQAPVIPVPILLPADRNDTCTHFGQLQGFRDDMVEKPFIDDCVKQVGRCKLVITGSYHAAVFALSQGIPAIGLGNSEYYVTKFAGLKSMFRIGFQFIDLRDINWVDRLNQVAEEYWETAGSLRDDLIRTSELQIGLSKEAYLKLASICSTSASAD